MIKNGIEKEIWPILSEELTDNKTFAVTPNTYPKKEGWTEYHHHKLSIMLEDPDRPPTSESAVPWACRVILKRTNVDLAMDMNLDVYLPRSVDIKDVVAIMDHPYLTSYPSLTLEDFPQAGPHYCLHFAVALPPSAIGTTLKRKMHVLDGIVDTLYTIENNSKDKKALADLTELLLEMQ